MGVLDTLGEFNESVEETSDAVLDNDAFSVQDTVRGSIQAVSGAGEGGKQDFAEDSAQTFKDLNSLIAAPGKAVGKATQGTAVNNDVTSGAVEGGEALYEMFVEHPAAVAYGSATGANVQTNDPSRATAEFSPDAIDTLEVGGILAGGVGGRLAGKAVRGGAKAAKGGSMGILSKTLDEGTTAVKGLVGKTDEAADARRVEKTTDAADRSTSTQTKLADAFEDTPSQVAEETASPAFLSGKVSDITSSLSDEASRAASSRLNQGIFGGAVGLGVLGLAGAPNLPGGMSVDKTYQKAPGGRRIKQKDTSGGVMGWWVVVDSDGGTHTVLYPNGGTKKMDFPVEEGPTYKSPESANTAYHQWAKQYREGTGGETTTATNNDRDTSRQSYSWGEPVTLKLWDDGWTLFEQTALDTEEEVTRYIVAGKSSDGSVIYLNGSGKGVSSAYTFETRQKAEQAHQTYAQNKGGVAPDPKKERPNPDPGPDPNTSGGVMGALIPILGGGALAALAVYLYTRYL